MDNLVRSVSHAWDNLVRSRSYLMDKLVGSNVLKHSTLQKYQLPFVFVSLKGPPQLPRYMAIGFCGVHNSLLVFYKVINSLNKKHCFVVAM